MKETQAASSPAHRRLQLTGGLCGIIGIILPMGMIFVAIQRSPWFDWRTNVLSDLGVHNTAPLFNSAMILGGILTLVFVFGLRSFLSKTKLTTSGIACLLLGSISLIFIGIFTLAIPVIHAIVAYSYFTLTPLGMLLIAFGERTVRLRWFSVIVGCSALLAIYLIPFALTPFSLGFGIPELLETSMLEIWVIILSVMLLRGQRA